MPALRAALEHPRSGAAPPVMQQFPLPSPARLGVHRAGCSQRDPTARLGCWGGGELWLGGSRGTPMAWSGEGGFMEVPESCAGLPALLGGW